MILLPSVKDLIIVVALLAIVMMLTIKTGKLSRVASLAAGVVGLTVFLGTGYMGLTLLGVFFLLGTLATSHRKELKPRLHANDLLPDKRNAGQVFANGGVAAITGMIAIWDREHVAIYQLLVAASLASAAADTLSSELGMVYGRRFYNILTFQKEEKGLDGVVSTEGTWIGIAAAALTGGIYFLFTDHATGWVIILVAGTLGNLADSVLGAVWERKRYIGNNTVNFLNTLLAALVAWIGYVMTGL